MPQVFGFRTSSSFTNDVSSVNNKVIYPKKFKPGDKAKCLKTIYFCNRTSHKKGQIIIVTERTVSYFNVNHNDYEKVGNS